MTSKFRPWQGIRWVSEALKKANADIAREQARNTDYDATDFGRRYEDAITSWKETAEELGYVDAGEYGNLGDWFEGDLNAVDDDYLDATYAAAYASVASSRRPA